MVIKDRTLGDYATRMRENIAALAKEKGRRADQVLADVVAGDVDRITITVTRDESAHEEGIDIALAREMIETADTMLTAASADTWAQAVKTGDEDEEEQNAHHSERSHMREVARERIQKTQLVSVGSNPSKMTFATTGAGTEGNQMCRHQYDNRSKQRDRWMRNTRNTIAVLCLALTWMAQDKAEASDETQRVNVDGRKMHITCRGKGKPVVVFESGIGGKSEEWVQLQNMLKTTTRACRYDRWGYGQSDHNEGTTTAQNAADTLKKVLHAAGEEGPYVLVAHSYGGFVARLAAGQGKIMINGLVLLDSSSEHQFERMESNGARALAPSGHNTRIQMQEDNQTAQKMDPRALTQAIQHARTSLRELEGFRESARQVRNVPRPKRTTPIIVLWRTPLNTGEREREWAKLQEELADTLGATHANVVARAGHAIHRDRPDAVEDAITKIVKQVRNETRSARHEREMARSLKRRGMER